MVRFNRKKEYFEPIVEGETGAGEIEATNKVDPANDPEVQKATEEVGP